MKLIGTWTNSLAAFLIAILSGLGVGSGGLFAIYLTATNQASVAEARSANLFFFIISAAAASVINIKKARYDPKLIFMLASLGILGSILGTYAAGLISPAAIKKVFGLTLVATGAYSLLSNIFRVRKRRSHGI